MTINSRLETYDQRLGLFYSNAENAIGDNFQDILESLRISKNQKNLLKLPLTQTIRLLEELNVSLDSVMKGNIDYACLQSQFLGDDKLPEKYVNKLPYSSRYTTIYMLHFISNEFGEKTTESIMKRFQLKKSHLKDMNSTNNFLLPFDICNYVFEYFGEDMVEAMGRSSYELLAKSENGKRLSQSVNLTRMFEHFFEDIAPKSIEKNYFWRIEKQTADSVTVAGTPNPEIKEAFGTHHQLSTEAATILRKGFLEALPSLIGDFQVSVETSRQVRSGSLSDLYHISYQRQ